tara:strand:- start:4960 stop:5121 length:162 start_codon:yes stop_codon:yes gene_type:complete
MMDFIIGYFPSVLRLARYTGIATLEASKEIMKIDLGETIIRKWQHNQGENHEY